MDLKIQKMLAETVANANRKTVSPYTTTAKVTSITGDTVYVKIPGSENSTPVKASSVSVKVGDVVDVSVSHSDTHITGNRSDVAVAKTTTDAIASDVAANRLLLDNEIDMTGNKIRAVNNNINLINNNIDIQNTKIEAMDSTITAQGSNIEAIDSTVKTQGSTIEAQGSKITTLESTVNTQGSSIETINSNISNIDSTLETHRSSISALDSNIKIINTAFVIKDGKLTGISEIVTGILDAGYVTTDLLNASVGWIENGKIKEGAIGTVEIADSSITTAKIKELSADTIKTGTLKTECLILTTDEVDPETGEKKVALITALNAKTKSGEGNILDGAVIADDTITASKITVVDLKAFGATIGNFTIDTSNIHNGKTGLTDPTNGVYIGTDGIALGQGSLLDMTDDSPFRVESDGDFHLGGKNSNYINFDPFKGELNIDAKNIKMGSSSIATVKNVSDAKDAAISAAASDATTKANNAKTDAVSTAASDATAKANQAKSDAISAAASDATTKANQAKTDAVSAVNETLKSYATLDITNNKISSAVTESKAYTDAVKIGGRNLLLNTLREVTTNGYEITSYPPSTPLVVGEKYIATLCLTPAKGVQAILLFVSGGMSCIAVLNVSGISRQIVSCAFTMRSYWSGQTPEDGMVYANVSLYRIPNDGTVTGDTTIHWIKIEKGNKATDWSPAPEDLEADATNKASNAVTEAKSYVDQTAESIKSTVQDVNGRLTTMEQNASGFTWTIDETAIVSSVNEYYKSTSATSLSGGSWSESQPTWSEGTYIWMRTKNTNGKGTVSYTTAVCITGNTGATGAKGDKGDTGSPGKDGADGTNGKDGAKGDPGTPGKDGTNGKDGRGISSTAVTYQAGSSGTTVPTGTWSSSIPSVSAGQYLWTKTVTNYTSGNPTTAYSVGRMGTNGTNGSNGSNGSDGKGIKSTAITYQAWSSGTSTPTGTWSTSVPSTTADKPYLWTKTVITYTDNTTSTSYSVGSTPEGIVVGGRNLFRQSGHWTTEPTWWVDNGGGLELDTSVQYMGYNTIKTIVGGGIVGNYNRYFELDTNKIYTYSAMIKLTGDDYPGAVSTPLHYHCSSTGDDYGQSGGVDVIKYKQNLVNGEWNLLYLTFKPRGKYFRPFVFLGGGSTRVFNIAYLKLEEGNKATDWTPAPEDVEADATNKAKEAAKTATNYMKFANNGLTVGNMTASTLGRNVLIDSDSVDIRSGTKVLASYGENISLYKDGMEAFTIKDSELLKNATDLNRTFTKVKYTTSGSTVTHVVGTGGTCTISAGTTYKWKFAIGSKTKYVVIVPTTSYSSVDQLVWVAEETNNLYVMKSTGSSTYSKTVPCVYLDENAVVDLSLNGSVRINNSGDLHGSAKGLPPLSIGVDDGDHLELDGNEIAAKSDDTTPSHLYLNMEGGNVSINNNCDRAVMFQDGAMFAKKSSGSYADQWLGIVDGFNESNNTTFGYGNYINNIGQTNIYGYKANVISKGAVVLQSGNDLSLTVGDRANNISANTSFVVPNGKSFVGTSTSGDLRNNFQPCNTNNNCVIGYGSYSLKEGATNIYGDYLSLTTNLSYIMNNKAMVIPTISVYSVTTQTLKTSAAQIAVGSFDSTNNQTTIGSTYFKSTNGGVKCLLSGWVKVSAQISLTGLTDGDGVNLYIYKNSTNMCFTYTRLNTSGEISIIDHVFKVAANDMIYIYGRNITAARGTINNNWYGASLTVTYVN